MARSDNSGASPDAAEADNIGNSLRSDGRRACP